MPPLNGNSDEAWRAYGRNDPFYGVLSDPKFRRENLTESALAEFYQSGRVFVDELLSTIRTHLDSTFAPGRVIEFGCGVGRLTIPLAQVAREVVAVDVSPDMMELARRRCLELGVGNVTFAASDDALVGVTGTFHLAVSFIVFQHLPAARTARIISALLDRVDPGGIVALHVNYAGPGSRWRRTFHHLRKVVPFMNHAANLLEGRRFGDPMMQMNRTSLNRMLGWFHRHGCTECFIRLTDHGGERGVMVYGRKRPECANKREPSGAVNPTIFSL